MTLSMLLSGFRTDRGKCFWRRCAVVVGFAVSGCITTPVPSPGLAGLRPPEGEPAVAPSAPESMPPAVEEPEPAPLPLDDVRYAEQLTVPSTPAIWIHRPDPVSAALARLTEQEVSRRLDAGELAPEERASALLERARARGILWRLEDALTDLDAALRLQPGAIEVELERAWLLGALSRTREAARRMSELFQKQKSSPETARVLGLIRYQEGRYAAAASALEFYLEDGSAPPSLVLLQTVADARSTGEPLKRWKLDPLTTGASVLWPGPIAGYLLGRIDAETLLDTADRAPAASPAEALCQAWFFIGQNERMLGNRDAAARALLAAVHTRATPAVEYRLATAELIHLGVLAVNSLPGTPAW